MPSDDENTRDAVTVHIVDAFVKDGQGGNPAGVVLDADDLGEAAMRAIAARVGLSETAFVSRSRTEGARLDFFTPTRRIAHCGHATIAAFALMAATGRIADGKTSKETVDGPRPIRVTDGMISMGQLAPRYRPASDWPRDGVDMLLVRDALGLDAEKLEGGFAPQVVDTGNRFLVLGVTNRAVLAELVPDPAAITRISEALDLIGFYVFTTATEETGEDATARMFAPRYGIAEESATGMAAGPLACVLHDFFGNPKPRLVIEQGAFMRPASPSRIDVEFALDGDRITGLMVGGRGRVRETHRITLPGLHQSTLHKEGVE